MVESKLVIPKSSELGEIIKKVRISDKDILSLTEDECYKSPTIDEIWVSWSFFDYYLIKIDHIYSKIKSKDAVVQAILILYKSLGDYYE